MTFEGRVAKAENFIRERTGWHGLGAEMLRQVFADLYGEKPTHVLVPVSEYMSEEQLLAAIANAIWLPVSG